MKSHFGMKFKYFCKRLSWKGSVPSMTNYPIDGFGEQRDGEMGKEILGIEV